jgi:phospholipid-binding lipoprotein MlaA
MRRERAFRPSLAKPVGQPAQRYFVLRIWICRVAVLCSQRRRKIAGWLFSRLLRKPGSALARAVVLALLFSLTWTVGSPSNGISDPFESLNRRIFEANVSLDRWVLTDVSRHYRADIPEPVQRGVHNALQNLRAPIILINDLLQGRVADAGRTLERFCINSLLGLGGVRDIAAENGLLFQDNDVGRTFSAWGIPQGPFLMLPLLGPSSARDAAGVALGFLLDPFNAAWRQSNLIALPYVRSATQAIDLRAGHAELVSSIERQSVDAYVTVRSMYEQRRGDERPRGAPPDIDRE